MPIAKISHHPNSPSRSVPSVSLWQNLFLRNEPNFLCKLFSIKMIRMLEISASTLIKPIQGSEGIVGSMARPSPRPC
jgi:hypothetical protein